MARFCGKTAIVTGSSTGIGRGIAVMFAREGAEVIITGRNAESLEETRRQCIAAGASEANIHTIIGDFGIESTLHELIDGTISKFGKIDILVNNTGVSDKDNSGKASGLTTQDMESFDYIFHINLRCIVELTKLALPHLEKTKGEIVNISSITAEARAVTAFPFYSMSKIGLDQFTRCVAIECIKKGVRINCIKPGAIESKFLERQGASSEDVSKNALSNDFMMIPAGYVGTPDDVANLTAFLCDRSQSRYIVGQCIVLDGGSTLVCPIMTADQK